jgi:hypothetical protein
MTRRELIQHLLKTGCTLARESERHSWWANPKTRQRAAIPRNAEIADSLARKIRQDLGIDPP